LNGGTDSIDLKESTVGTDLKGGTHYYIRRNPRLTLLPQGWKKKGWKSWK